MTPAPAPPPPASPLDASAVRAFLALVSFSFRRHLRVRQVGWVAFGLLAVLAGVIAMVTHGPVGWRVENRQRQILGLRVKEPSDALKGRYQRYGDEQLPVAYAVPGPPGALGIEAAVFDAFRAAMRDERVLADNDTWGHPFGFNLSEDANSLVTVNYQVYGDKRLSFYQGAIPGPPDAFGIKSAVFDAYRVLLREESKAYRDDYAFLNFVRWVVFGLFLAFLLPLFTLAFASGAMGTEREGRTLLWLVTRPLPRWGIYLAKLVAVLPWCVGVCLFGFVALCLVGGELGRKAVGVYWPTVLAAAVAFGCLFHMVGTLFRRPTVVGLVYVFFFETLVGNLPGSMKQFSLNYYVRSLFYNETAAAVRTIRPESVDVYAPADSATAWLTLLLVSAAVTLIGMWRFGEQEPKDEV